MTIAGGPTPSWSRLAAIAALGMVALPAHAQSPQGADPVAARVQACAACHGDLGQGTDDAYFPRLAGKPAGYLLHQLTAFRSGRRRYAPMHYLLEFQTDAYLKAMADYFAAQRPPLPPPAVAVVSDAILARGRTLVAVGDTGRQIPACSNCHGPALTGTEPAIPGLLGLHAGYISAQLGAWRYGTRTALAPDCMQIVAANLTEDDVKAVAAWLSAQPAPTDATPRPREGTALPLACGSEPEGGR